MDPEKKLILLGNNNWTISSWIKPTELSKNMTLYELKNTQENKTVSTLLTNAIITKTDETYVALSGATNLSVISGNTDDGYGSISIASSDSFTIGASSYSTVYVSTNGWIQFTSPTNVCLKT